MVATVLLGASIQPLWAWWVAPTAPQNWPVIATALNATEGRLKHVCLAQGHLQRRATSAADYVDVFEMLGFDPAEQPFSLPGAVTNSSWHQEVKYQVHVRRQELLWRSDEAHAAAYNDAITSCANLLADDDTLKFYVNHIYPMLRALAVKKPAICMWPRIRALHNMMCINTWPTLGMVDLVEEANNHPPTGPTEYPECFRLTMVERLTRWVW